MACESADCVPEVIFVDNGSKLYKRAADLHMTGQGSHNLDLIRGHKGPVKAYVQRECEGSTHIYLLTSLLMTTA
jgi:hypothetical protein